MLSVFFHPVATGQADILSSLSPEQLAQFNLLPPQQRQALLSQLQLGSTSGFELPVSQPQTVNLRIRGSIDNGVNDNESNFLLGTGFNFLPYTGIDKKSAFRVLEEKEETPEERILRKAEELFDLGIDVTALDTYGELTQMGIIAAIQAGSQADEENIFVIKSSGEVIPYSRNRNFFSFSDPNSFSLEAGDSIVIPYFAVLGSPLVTWMNISTVLALQSIGDLD